MESSLKVLVSALPEQYQPIYGHPDLTYNTLRACNDRLAIIAQVWTALSARLGRPARVLDLGCAQGYISLALAERGAVVLGIDHNMANIALCKALSDEHPQFFTRFARMSIEQFFGLFFEKCDFGTFDLVLGLSVFHHMAYVHGHEVIERWLAALAKLVPVGIFELALAEEPPSWAAALPEDERTLLSGFAFVHELTRVRTHLSEVRRPLIFASNHAWYFDGYIDTFASMTRHPRDRDVPIREGTRQYFMNDRMITKVYSLKGSFKEDNLLEIGREAVFLTRPPENFAPLPKVSLFGMNEQEIWIVRERLPGDLLYHLILEEKPYDVDRVIHDILKQLVVLENASLAHADLRTWNVLIMPNGAATLIDYGAIVSMEKFEIDADTTYGWFWLLVWAATTKSTWSGSKPPSPLPHPEDLAHPYASWARAFWRLPDSEWSFAKLLEIGLRFSSLGLNDPQRNRPEMEVRNRPSTKVYELKAESTEKSPLKEDPLSLHII